MGRASETVETRPIRILWVEDNPALRKSLELLDEAMDDEVRVIASFEAALVVLHRDGPFDWVVCDYHMREGSCPDFVAQVRDAGPRIVVLARRPSEVTIDAPVLRQPIALVDLVSLLREEQRWIDARATRVRQAVASGPRRRVVTERSGGIREIPAPPNPKDPRRE